MKTLLRSVLVMFIVASFSFVYATTATTPSTTKLPKNFWADGYQAQWISQTSAGTKDEYFMVQSGSIVTVTAKFKNTGKNTWQNTLADRQVCIAIYKDAKVQSSWTDKDKSGKNFGKSEFKSTNWQSDYRISCVEENEVKPGEIGTFVLNFTIPENAPSGKFREDITLASGPYWMESAKATADPLGAAHIWVGFTIQGSTQPTVVPTVAPVANLENEVLALLNKDRATQGKSPIVLDEILTQIAYLHSKDQAENLHTISHTGSNGSTLGTRLDVGGAGHTTAGENVGMTMGMNDTVKSLKTIEGLFFNEVPPNDGHRKNILNADFTKVGIGIYVKGDEVYVTQDFSD